MEGGEAMALSPSRTLTLGTRASKLALVQTEIVRMALNATHPALDISVEHITTRGDIVLDRPLNMVGGKGLFITEIEEALRTGQIDLAVHSAKDLPSELASDMQLGAISLRADPRDAVVSQTGARLNELPAGARIGTSSVRRACQLRQLRPDATILDLRGNVDTRLRKLHEGQYDAIILAAAGLDRLGLAHEIAERLEPDVMIPAVAQGALSVECRLGDEPIIRLLAPLNDDATRTAVLAERAFLATLGGSCSVPAAAYAHIQGDSLTIIGMIGAADGRIVRGRRSGPITQAQSLGRRLAKSLLARGGAALLAEAQGVHYE
jgi:hydroxymethylbilane synthase